jgi:hypothetical protein
MPSHLALLSCLLVLLLSFDKFLFHYLKRRWFSGGSGATVPRAPAKWSETTMLVIDMQVWFLLPLSPRLAWELFRFLDFELILGWLLTVLCLLELVAPSRRTSWTRQCAARCWWPVARPSSLPLPGPSPSQGSAAFSLQGSAAFSSSLPLPVARPSQGFDEFDGVDDLAEGGPQLDQLL